MFISVIVVSLSVSTYVNYQPTAIEFLSLQCMYTQRMLVNRSYRGVCNLTVVTVALEVPELSLSLSTPV